MNPNCIRNLTLAIVFSFIVAPMTVSAHEAVDPLHSIPVEIVGSRLAYPTQIHVQVVDEGVEVKGKLKRKDHKNTCLCT